MQAIKQIASFLRMRPESLSRLKAQMKQSEKRGKKHWKNILVTKRICSGIIWISRK